MTGSAICMLLAIFAYLGLTIYVGVYFSKKGSGEDTENFYLGGRALHPVVDRKSTRLNSSHSH